MVGLPLFTWAGTGTFYVDLLWSRVQEDTPPQPLASLPPDISQVMKVPDMFLFYFEIGFRKPCVFVCGHVYVHRSLWAPAFQESEPG